MVARIEEALPVDEQQRLVAILRRFEAAGDYAIAHHDELLRDYPEQWVAVSADGFMAANPTWQELLSDLRGAGMDPAHLYIQFITAKHPTLIL
jgi:hypothetical protein